MLPVLDVSNMYNKLDIDTHMIGFCGGPVNFSQPWLEEVRLLPASRALLVPSIGNSSRSPSLGLS